MPAVKSIEDAIGEVLQRKGRSNSVAAQDSIPATRGEGEHAGDGIAGHFVDECESLALAMQQTGSTVVTIANEISEETEALADLLRKHGAAMRARIEEFMTMSDRVKDRMRSAHGDIAGFSGRGQNGGTHDAET